MTAARCEPPEGWRQYSGYHWLMHADNKLIAHWLWDTVHKRGHWSINVRSNVLTGVDVVVLPERTRLVIGTDLFKAEVDQVHKRIWQTQRWRVCRQLVREVYNADFSSAESSNEICINGHFSSFSFE